MKWIWKLQNLFFFFQLHLIENRNVSKEFRNLSLLLRWTEEEKRNCFKLIDLNWWEFLNLLSFSLFNLIQKKKCTIFFLSQKHFLFVLFFTLKYFLSQKDRFENKSLKKNINSTSGSIQFTHLRSNLIQCTDSMGKKFDSNIRFELERWQKFYRLIAY